MINGQELSCVQIEGPIRTENTIFEHTVPQRTDPFRRVSLRTKRLHAWFRLAGNPGASPQDSHKGVSRYLQAYRIEGQKEDEKRCGFALPFAKIRQR